ncbi:hypothetical protein HYX13_00470 [Candidatus Woesearchaeota archaeon]|nr:hypothetical protein [Candidatus Woesearchaeota archaeon]
MSIKNNQSHFWKKFSKKFSKKGSLNLSIEAIVVVVIAFVVLGLGLGFVRGQFKDITDTSSGIQEQIRQKILEDLRTGDQKLSFPAQTLSIPKGEAADIAIGVKNNLNNELTFTIKVETKKSQTGGATNLNEQVEYFYDQGPFTLKPTDAQVYNIKISAPGDKDTYLVNLKIELSQGGEIYAEKSFFVNII